MCHRRGTWDKKEKSTCRGHHGVRRGKVVEVLRIRLCRESAGRCEPRELKKNRASSKQSKATFQGQLPPQDMICVEGIAQLLQWGSGQHAEARGRWAAEVGTGSGA